MASSRPRIFEGLRQLPLVGRALDWGMGASAASAETRQAGSRIAGLKVTESICPYCAVGCGQLVYTRDGELIDIEGNPRSPISQGTLCPKGAASRQLIQQPGRLTKIRYRRPHGTEWEELDLETAMDMIAERLIRAREDGWQERDERGWKVDSTMASRTSAGARSTTRRTTSSEAVTALGAIQIENQARI
jgi:formate dehydrogenase major subunit